MFCERVRGQFECLVKILAVSKLMLDFQKNFFAHCHFFMFGNV